MSKQIEIKKSVTLSHKAKRLYYYGEDFVIAEGDIPLQISCMKISTADIQWTQKVGYFRFRAYENGILYFGYEKTPGSHYYAALDVLTGKIKWDANVGSSYKVWHGFGPFITENTLAIVTNTSIISFDKATGKKRYKTKINDYNEAVKPMLWNGKIVIQGGKRKTNFYAYDIQTGELVQTIPAKKGMDYYINHFIDYVLIDDTCYYVSPDLFLRSVNFATGAETEHKIPQPGALGRSQMKYKLRRDGDILTVHFDHTFQREVDGEKQDINQYEIEFDIKSNTFANEMISDELAPRDRELLVSAGIGMDDLSVTIGNSTIDMPKYGEDSRIWRTVSPTDTMKLVLQQCVDACVIHVVE